MLTFSKSEVDNFRHTNRMLRWGQAFHLYMNLKHVYNGLDQNFCDRLYAEKDDEKAKEMVRRRIDPQK